MTTEQPSTYVFQSKSQTRLMQKEHLLRLTLLLAGLPGNGGGGTGKAGSATGAGSSSQVPKGTANNHLYLYKVSNLRYKQDQTCMRGAISEASFSSSVSSSDSDTSDSDSDSLLEPPGKQTLCLSTYRKLKNQWKHLTQTCLEVPIWPVHRSAKSSCPWACGVASISRNVDIKELNGAATTAL